MPERHLLPIPLPNGRTWNQGRLTVYFSPRLKEDGILSDYPEFGDWPTNMSGLTLEVLVNGSVVPHRVVSVAPSTQVWQATFAPDTPVRAHRFKDYSATPLVAMASSDFSEAVLDLYVELARQYPERSPTGTDLLSLPQSALLADSGTTGEAKAGSIAEATAYQEPMENPKETAEAPGWDFHEYISLLGHHPELLRHLGIAVDLEVQLPAAPTEVIVRTDYRAQYGPAGRSVLVATNTTQEFLALPNPDPKYREQVDGFLDLQAQKAFLSIVDPHTTAQRLASVGARLPGDDGDVPALQTRALTLVRPDLLTAFHNRNERQAEIEEAVYTQVTVPNAPPVAVYGEDITQGQRIDALPKKGVWRSLFERQTEEGYQFPRDPKLAPIPVKTDESWRTTTIVTEQEEVLVDANQGENRIVLATAQRRVDDEFYRWDGWSGAVPPPGGAVDAANNAVAPVDPNEPATGDPVQVKVDYTAVPGSLPTLRFGETYQMRARCVGLAGDSVAPDETSPPGADAPEEQFGRLDPVAAPMVLRRSARPDPGVGDTATTLVIKSELGQDDSTVLPTDRVLFPGRIGQDLCEFHGLPNGGIDPGSYAELVARDALQLSDQTLRDPDTGELVAGVLVKDEIAPGPFRQVVEYLSEPAAGGIRFFLPELDDEVLVTMRGTWPALESARLELAAGSDTPLGNPDADTDCRVFLPQAEIGSIDVSLSLDDAFIDHFALWQRLTDEEKDQLRTLVLNGGHWMITPARRIKLVHAVRVPLLAPQVLRLRQVRGRGKSSATLRGDLTVHRKSTERVTLAATWTDPVDDVNLPGPEDRTTTVQLGELLTSRSDETTFSFTGLRAELHDTKYHRAQISVEAFSSFSSYFTEQTTIDMETDRALIDARGVVAGSVEVTSIDGGRKAEAGRDYLVHGPSGTMRLLPDGTIPPGAEICVKYIPLPVSRHSSEGVEVFEMNFPSTVAPTPPVVHSVVPAFARKSSARGSSTAVHHSGQVLRVYLSRPWFVSGDGELLGVVVPTDATDVEAATWIGRDPIVSGGGPTQAPRATDFPRASEIVNGVDGRYDVAGHPVEYDPDQKLWYADIEFASSDTYRPFARLTLARLQPVSLPGVELSTQVSVDPVRLGVVRDISVRRAGSDVFIEALGSEHDGIPDASQKAAPDLQNVVEVTVQEEEPGITDPDLVWRDASSPVQLTRTTSGPVTIWSGNIVLSDPAASARVVIEELEPSMMRDGRGTSVGWNQVHVETMVVPAKVGAARRVRLPA